MTESPFHSTAVNATDIASVTEGTLIQINWIDAHHVADAWQDLEEIEDDQCLVRSVGFFVSAVNEQIIYAADWVDKGDEEVHVNSVSAIPFGCIKRMRVMENDVWRTIS